MKDQYLQELTPEVREKMKRNLVYVSILGICMLFAGLTSGYYVSMSDSFWVKYPLPDAFYISTVIILLSSVVLQIAVVRLRKGNSSWIKGATVLTLLSGILFAYFQFTGYAKLVDDGAHAVSKIVVQEGKYGEYYSVRYNNKYVDIDGNQYYVGNRKMNASELKELSEFGKTFDHVISKKEIPSTWNKNIQLYFKNEPVTFKDGKLLVSDSLALQYVDLDRLENFAIHLRDGRGDFFHKGQYGKDFIVYYKRKPLEYKNRSLYLNGRKLDARAQISMNSAADNATSYLYIITFVHLLHIIAAIIYMFSLTIRSFTGSLAKYNYLSFRMGTIFWHFFGGLWVYLLLFLLFIH